ncbi:MAG: bifunctional diaminohydroxyphosphoribosylaminopyrimidine deaminase/5-amino-6-(5-phosphoribosylamino)uracil reductase RibD [Desulfarculus sp.]|nr:bifunctional diaminohydroxyphosphoribosylaminopyrimidine deaminase/5-amino-6-(5-phosphoribosylamino)uracil reductase RibD [Desulfarculus sp.]
MTARPSESAPPDSAVAATDRRFMRLALGQARRGLGRSSPNPAVGAVVVKDGAVVGRGFHARAGEPHAEVHALAAAGAAARGAAIYVTLEPCNHHGRTPPCTQAILAAGIARVVYGASDPNPKAQGGGEFLRQAGLAVTGGVLEAACRAEHRFFLTHVTQHRPHVVLKTAATLDGRTATVSGDSRWVTGPAARREVHRWRNWCDAICVGIGTALADDPQLTCRLEGGRDPLRVIVDTSLRLPATAKVLDPASPAGCLVACGPRPDPARRAALEAAGAQVLPLPRGDDGRVDLGALLTALGRRGVTSLLLEGGAGLAWGFVRAGLVDEVMYFLAPKLIGGAAAPGMIGGRGFARMAEALPLGRVRVRRLGDDLCLSAPVMAAPFPPA